MGEGTDQRPRRLRADHPARERAGALRHAPGHSRPGCPARGDGSGVRPGRRADAQRRRLTRLPAARRHRRAHHLLRHRTARGQLARQRRERERRHAAGGRRDTGAAVAAGRRDDMSLRNGFRGLGKSSCSRWTGRSLLLPILLLVRLGCGPQAGRMLMTREMTTTRTAREMSDWITISPLARWLSGMASVGLNATTLVYATYR